MYYFGGGGRSITQVEKSYRNISRYNEGMRSRGKALTSELIISNPREIWPPFSVFITVVPFLYQILVYSIHYKVLTVHHNKSYK
jgi:hypothetical protein